MKNNYCAGIGRIGYEWAVIRLY